MADLEPVLAAYGLRATEIKPIQTGVYKIITPQENYCLKECSMAAHKLDFIQRELMRLPERGFCHLSLPVAKADGQIITAAAQKQYILFPWVNGSVCDFYNRTHRLAAARCLAAFHNAAKNRPKIKGIRQMYHQWPYALQAKETDLIGWQEKTKTPANRFEYWYHHGAPYYIEKARKARRMLLDSDYAYLAAQAEQESAYIHWDIAPRNFMIGGDGEAWLIDFDYCRYDLPLHDIVRLFQRGMKAVDFSFAVFDDLLQQYCSIKPLSWEELQVIAAFLAFPQRFWRLSERYFNQQGKNNAAYFCHKLRETEIRRQKEEEVNTYFRAYYCH